MIKENSIGTMLIIGNGFDLNLGMKTSYKSFFEEMEAMGFWTYYKNNPLIAYIYEKGIKENWYSFEDIIKEFALESTESVNIVFCNKMIETIKQIHHFEDGVLPKISNYGCLKDIIPSIVDLIKECKKYDFINPKLLSSIKPVCAKIVKERNFYIDSVRENCIAAISLLKKGLVEFLLKAHPVNEYHASLKILCALLGCDGRGFKSWEENLKNKYNSIEDLFYLPKYRFVSFNYTDTIKWVMRTIKVGASKALEEDITSISKSIYNIHGKLDDNIAFGTDEDDNIPKELWCLRKCSYLGKNTKAIFYEDLCNSKRIVIFGHSINGIDFEYYEEFFKNKGLANEIYILSHTQESLDEIKKGLELKGVSVRAKYIIANLYNNDFVSLCDEINKEQSQK